MSFEKKAQELADNIEANNPHLSAVQVADMVFQKLVGEWTGSEANRRDHALIRRALGC